MPYHRRISATTSPSRRRFRPAVELLESRLPLAGNVTLVRDGVNLFLTGDDVANRLWISMTSQGYVEVQAVDTSLNGVLNQISSHLGIQNLSIDMRGGNDIVSLVRMNLPGRLWFQGGDGDDGLYFGYGNHETQSFGRVLAFLGAGDDTIDALEEKNLTVRNSLLVHGGAGNNFVDLRTDTSLNLGTVTYLGGQQNDLLLLSAGTSNTRSIVMIGGDGYNKLEWYGNANIDGYIIQAGGNGQDVLTSGMVTRQPSSIMGPILLQLGEGSNDVNFNASTTLKGDVRMTSGAGDDEFNAMDGYYSDQDFFFTARNIDLNLGDGDNSVWFSQRTHNIQSLTLTTGSGEDNIGMFDLNAQGPVAFNAGDGDNHFKLLNSNFFAPFSFSSGAGKDWVIVECAYVDDGRGTRFRSSAYFNLGDGDDLCWIGAFANTDPLKFDGSVFLGGGLGDDDLVTTSRAEYAFPPLLDSF